jgi:hypothetical protein
MRRLVRVDGAFMSIRQAAVQAPYRGRSVTRF